MPVVDTSLLVALRNPEDHHHSKALKAVKQAGPFIVPAVILAEYLAVVWAHARRTAGFEPAHKVARDAFDGLVKQRVFQIETAFDASKAATIFRTQARLSYPDAVAVAVAKEQATELITFDALQRRTFRAD